MAISFGSAIIVFFILFGVTAPATNESANNNERIEEKARVEAEKKEEEEKARIEAEKKEEEEKARIEAEKKADTEMLSQQQAVRMAEDYIDYTAFSKSGLIEQLEFEGFSNADAAYAVENINVDWKAQAVKMAQDYLDYTAFSKSGLIEQLVYEGFSNEVAAYAASEVGL